MKKIKGSYLVIGLIAVVAIIIIAWKKDWLGKILHHGDKPRLTPPDYTDRDAIEDIPVPLITESVRKSVYNGF
jgi:hypothetical protein